MSSSDPNFWTIISGLGSGSIAFITARVTGRQSREQRLEEFKDEVFKRVEAELADCRKHEKRSLIVEGCFRLAMGELLDGDRRNPVLRQVKAMLESLPIDPEVPNDMQALLDELKHVPWTKTEVRGGPDANQ